MRQPAVSPHPDTIAIRIHFAFPVSAATAGTVAHVFWTSRLRAQKTDMLDAAITASQTIEHHAFDRILQGIHYD